MSKKVIRNSILLIITAAIWGFAFVAQAVGGEAVGPYAFNFIRFVIGSLVLLPVIFIKYKITQKDNSHISKDAKKTLITGSVLCGLALCVASNFQQLGINMGTSAGKAGFLTACYILLVPILGIFLKKKCPWTVWLGVVITLGGLFLLCVDLSEGFKIQLSDLIVFICAFCFSIQILLVDKYSPLVDGVRLSCLQFAVAGVVSAIPTFIFDMNCNIANAPAVFRVMLQPNAIIPILYAGVMSCGVAYTFQIIGQNGLNPTVASLLMSLESVFSVIGGWLILSQKLTIKEIIGCILVFIAICLAQIDLSSLKHKK